MLRRAEAAYKYTLHAKDGDIGGIRDFYFDDATWTVRYIVADTGSWLREKLVLISPHGLVSIDDEGQMMTASLTRDQIESGPLAEANKPVSRQFEVNFSEYYGWPQYWVGLPYSWGTFPESTTVREPPTLPDESAESIHLRSTREVEGYGVGAVDGDIGHIADFVIDDTDWVVRYLIVDTRSWWPGKHVLLPPQWIERVSWTDRRVYVNLLRHAIKAAPEYTEGSEISRDLEVGLCRHYGKEAYWTEKDCPTATTPPA
jgi:uncharacterized protein YrrD